MFEDKCDLDNCAGLIAQVERDLREGAKAEGSGPRAHAANTIASQLMLCRLALRGLVGERGSVGVGKAPTDGGR